MENCPNCDKLYKTRGIKLHLRKCVIPIEKIMNLPLQPLQKSVISYSNYTLLPDDCIKIILEYAIMKDKDKHTTYYKMYKEIFNIIII